MTEFSVFVDGRPAPKGSLEGIGAGRVRESNRASEDWRAHVAAGCRRLAAGMRWQALAAPVDVELRFFFERPTAPRWDVPATVETGDVDKLVRNVLDALSACDASCRRSRARSGGCRKHAAVIEDDALVCDLAVKVRYAAPWGMAGVFIVVRALDLSLLPRYGPLEVESLGKTPKARWPK